MFEKELRPPYCAVTAKSRDNAKYISIIYDKNIEHLYGRKISPKEWLDMLLQDDPHEENYLICRGIVPVAWLKINGLESPDRGCISMLAVDPKFQHMGVGKFAVLFAQERLRSMGKKQTFVQTTEDNLPAMSLYKKCGFEEKERYLTTAEYGTEVVKVVFLKGL